MKRVDNYIKTIWSAERTLLAKGMTREENEAYQIEKERRNEWLDGCKIVDRVIATRETTAGAEYFVKWKSKLSVTNNIELRVTRAVPSLALQYNDATWESEQFVPVAHLSQVSKN